MPPLRGHKNMRVKQVMGLGRSRVFFFFFMNRVDLGLGTCKTIYKYIRINIYYMAYRNTEYNMWLAISNRVGISFHVCCQFEVSNIQN